MPADPTMADQPAGAIPPAIARQIREHGPVLDMPFTQRLYQPLLRAQLRDGVRIERDLAYGPDPRHRLDLYRGEQAVGVRPVIVFLHGGGFIRGDKADRDNIGLYFARAGYVVLVINYRLAPAHGWPAGAQDAAAAADWAGANARQHGGDPARIFLAGESAGAAHVAAAVLIRRFAPAVPIAGAVLISGVYHVQLEWRARRQFGIALPDVRNDAYFGTDPEQYPSRSTIELIDAAPLPLFISWAEWDLLQMQVQAGALFSRLVTRHGFDPELSIIQGHNHLTQVYAVNTGDESLTRGVRQFLEDHTP